MWHSQPFDEALLLQTLHQPSMCLLLSPRSEYIRINIKVCGLWVISVYRLIPISVPTVWRTFHRRKLSWGRTSVTLASIVHHVNQRSQLEQLRFKRRWRQKVKAEKKLNLRRWSRRKCITWHAWLVVGRPVTLESATKLLRPTPGLNRNTFTTLASDNCLSTSKQLFFMTSTRSKNSCVERLRKRRSSQAWLIVLAWQSRRFVAKWDSINLYRNPKRNRAQSQLRLQVLRSTNFQMNSSLKKLI